MQPLLSVSASFREAFRSLLLPIAPDADDAVLVKVQDLLERLHVAREDQPDWILAEIDRWHEERSPSSELTVVVQSAIQIGAGALGSQLANAYFKLHEDLQERHGYSHFEATALLLRSRLAAHLASSEHMSSAQIANVLTAQLSGTIFTWQAVQPVLAALKLEPQLTPEQVQGITQLDQEAEPLVFADAEIETAARIIAGVSLRLGFQGDLGQLLLDIYTPDRTTHWPYLQMLHYQCVIVEYYDHPPSVAYEFEPRGQKGEWLFQQYPVSTSSPFLNNAKGVYQLDATWAASRRFAQAGPARALAQLLEGLEGMGFEARREAAALIRRWLLRVIRMADPEQHVLAPQLSRDQINKLVVAVASAETKTAGIIEQRVVDAAISLLLPLPNWRGRGLGDSVNTTNISQRKVGDCDYQDAASRRILAYEAHAGMLSKVYARNHMRTLQRALELRVDELAGVADPSEWRLEVVFVAHRFESAYPPPGQDIGGVSVMFTFMTYEDLIGRVRLLPGFAEAFGAHVIRPLNERRTPAVVRQIFQRLAGD